MNKLQQQFARDVSQLIAFAFAKGLAVTFGEAYRTPEQAALDADKGTGIRSSLHTSRLAIDLLLFRDGEYQTKTEQYKVLGDYWESFGSDHCWGGRFTRADGNHFSITPDGGRTR